MIPQSHASLNNCKLRKPNGMLFLTVLAFQYGVSYESLESDLISGGSVGRPELNAISVQLAAACHVPCWQVAGWHDHALLWIFPSDMQKAAGREDKTEQLQTRSFHTAVVSRQQ